MKKLPLWVTASCHRLSLTLRYSHTKAIAENLPNFLYTVILILQSYIHMSF